MEDVEKMNLACSLTEIDDVGFYRVTPLAVDGDECLFAYKDRPDLAPQRYNIGDLQIIDEYDVFDSVAIIIGDKKVNKYLKKKHISYHQAELMVEHLSMKLKEDKVKLYFKLKDEPESGKPLVGTIYARGKPTNLGLLPTTEAEGKPFEFDEKMKYDPNRM